MSIKLTREEEFELMKDPAYLEWIEKLREEAEMIEAEEQDLKEKELENECAA